MSDPAAILSYKFNGQPLDALAGVFLDVAQTRNFRLGGQISELRNVGWTDARSEPLERMVRRVRMCDVAGNRGIRTRERYRIVRRFVGKDVGHLFPEVPWIPRDYEDHSHKMLRHPQFPGWVASIVGVRESCRYLPAVSTFAVHVFGPFSSNPANRLIDASELASFFDGSGAAFRTFNGDLRREGSHSWRHSLAEWGFHSRGHFSTGGRDRFDLTFAMRPIIPSFLPALDLPKFNHCALYSMGKTQISM